MINMSATHNLIPSGGMANDNARDLPGRSVCYYPEMGETAPARLFQGGGTGYIKWRTESDDHAREAFRKHRIRPSGIRCWDAIRGGKWWSAHLTYAAWRKLFDAGLIAAECLLD